ncbi:MAG: serine--tRNA ligase [Pseudomonadota bacterium]|nr:serine--tRNA ligase [Pseudomonadota bacterium]
MHDLRWIRENPDAFDSGLKRRGLEALAGEVLELDSQRRAAQTELQDIQTRRNEASKKIGIAKQAGEDADDIIAEVAALKDRMGSLEEQTRAHDSEIETTLSAVPNLPFDDVPDGADEADNAEIRKFGDPQSFAFESREHHDLGDALGLMDFESASKLSGARFVVLKGALARMERALAAFMLDIHTAEFGYIEINPPALVRDDALYGTGQLPKFGDDLFRTTTGHWLIPTAEVPLTNLVAGEILDEASLPRRYTAMTWCFRSEAGAAGNDTHGMIRQHQFTKVELVSIVHPDKSADEHERMTLAAEEVLKRLGLAYRVVVLATGDLGFSARKTYDLEVWLPGQGAYREISSCSNCGDFQARRMRARFRPDGGKGTEFVHTLNGSGLAVGRTLIAIMENYQREDGSIEIPEALRPYMGGLELIEAGG